PSAVRGEALDKVFGPPGLCLRRFPLSSGDDHHAEASTIIARWLTPPRPLPEFCPFRSAGDFFLQHRGMSRSLSTANARKQNDQPERTKHRQRRVAQRIVGDAPLKQGKSEYIRHTHRQAESEHRSAEDHPRERLSHTIWVAWSPGSSCNEY